jgi:PIN domain nuclease of toxin-antitoxin system
MPSVVVDTHAAVWYLLNDKRLSPAAGSILDRTTQGGDPILIPSISLVELIYLVEKGRIPASTQTRLRAAIDDPNGPFQLAPLDGDVADAVHAIVVLGNLKCEEFLRTGAFTQIAG